MATGLKEFFRMSGKTFLAGAGRKHTSPARKTETKI